MSTGIDIGRSGVKIASGGQRLGIFPAVACVARPIEEAAEAQRAASAEKKWTPKRIAAAKAFVAAKESLYRKVWRLGLQRHIFRFESRMPDWYDEFVKLNGSKKFESAIDKNDQA